MLDFPADFADISASSATKRGWSTEAVPSGGGFSRFGTTGRSSFDSPTDNQLDIRIPVADIDLGGSACPGALVAAGRDFASFFMRSWFLKNHGEFE